MDIDALQGRWTLLSTDTTKNNAGSELWFELQGTRISGFDGCNHFGGDLSSSRPLIRSQRGCEGERPEFPLDLSKPMAQLGIASLEGNELTLPLTGSKGVAIFIRQ
ncbi:META domain-containing protein [Granulosicoccus sp. 3-233]|uniref:META domain-containing protein n=1 Tax=Granulosicoccus sp. 3-233 TaxID=3417969 RepID=UPI003D352704